MHTTFLTSSHIEVSSIALTSRAVSTVVVVPCYNEAKRLPVAEYRAFSKDSDDCYFLFVDDGSTDETQSLLAGLQHSVPDSFGYLHCGQNLGKGPAVRLGFHAAIGLNPQFIAYWDSDLSAPMHEINPMIELLKRYRDVLIVMGAREYRQDAAISRTPWRSLGAQLFRRVRDLALANDVADTQCGAKVLRNCELVRAVFSVPFETRWMFDLEILLRCRAARKQTPMSAEPCHLCHPLSEWTEKPGSKVNHAETIRIFYEILRLRRRYHKRIKFGV